jgi:UDP-N-acetyl-D-mannosaminuronic acid transferase (WecB/TagA/CpsF family)
MIFDKILKTQDHVLKLVDKNLKDNSIILLSYLNQHCYNIYSSNNEYKELMDSHFNVYIDGIGIYFTLKLLKFNNIERFNGTDLIEKIFQLYSEKKIKLYLLGGTFSQKFIHKISKLTNLQIIHCVGGFFEFYFGKRRRVPKLLRTLGVEWITRLLQEPKRLWIRYLVGIPVFTFRIIKMKFNK